MNTNTILLIGILVSLQIIFVNVRHNDPDQREADIGRASGWLDISDIPFGDLYCEDIRFAEGKRWCAGGFKSNWHKNMPKPEMGDMRAQLWDGDRWVPVMNADDQTKYQTFTFDNMEMLFEDQDSSEPTEGDAD